MQPEEGAETMKQMKMPLLLRGGVASDSVPSGGARRFLPWILSMAVCFGAGVTFERVRAAWAVLSERARSDGIATAVSPPFTDWRKKILKIDKGQRSEPAKQIVLLGERHGGTNWITDHLTECFSQDIEVSNAYARFKHWFQDEELVKVPEKSTVIVAMFRDPYDWVEAMRVEPHHAHDHVKWNATTIKYDEMWRKQGGRLMSWRDFVTKPWIGRRGPEDRRIVEANLTKSVECVDMYSFAELTPCSLEDSPMGNGLASYKYELRHDRSGRAYSSVIDLRRDKVLNFLSVADYRGTRAFLPYRYEDLKRDGTAGLLREVEEATGIRPRCDATVGSAGRRRLKKIVKHRELPGDYVEWMSQYVDWEVEAQIGYFRRQ